MAKRGRPRLLDDKTETMMRELGEFPASASLRTVQNWTHMGRACTLIASDRAFAWLNADGSLWRRKTLVTQLGRVKNETARKVFATRICTLKPTVQDGVRLVRLWRRRFDAMVATRIVDGEPIDAEALATKASTKNF